MKNWIPERLTELDLEQLQAWRHDVHRHPEISGEEQETARKVRSMLAPTLPDQVISDLGGHGVAAVYDSKAPGPTVLFRSETDALPIQELGDIAHRSVVPGKSHLCGHDGHSAILLGLARLLGRSRPLKGRVVLMFQPAEEDGSGAAAVIADPRYESIRPDFAFSLHNMPGHAMGEGYISAGPANCASRGIRVRLTGSTAHAAQPEKGRSPMRAIASLMPAFEDCSSRTALGPGFSLVTVTHTHMGEPVYGIAPGHAEIRATLRTVGDDEMGALCARVEALAVEAARASNLACEIDYADVFLACTNDATAVDYLRQGMDRAGVVHHDKPEPQRASEDFGRFGHTAKAAMVVLGAGMDTPAVHTPTYDFPDELIAPGVRLFSETLAAVMDGHRSKS